jgi:hypothetical protein
LIALLQTPHHFRTKRQLWTYSGLGLETHDSAQYRAVEGQLQRSKKPVSLRGLNKNHNHDLKGIFKGAAMRASTAAGPAPRFLPSFAGQRKKAHDGATDAGEKDCRDYADRVEEGGTFRRQSFETTNSLSASG